MTANDLTKQLIRAIEDRFPGSRAWRSNVGAAVPMAIVRQAIAALHTASAPAAARILGSARVIKFGIPGLPDIDGFIPVTINGRTIGVRLGVEVKVGRDRVSREQDICRAVYTAGGCLYVLASDNSADPVQHCLHQISMMVDTITGNR